MTKGFTTKFQGNNIIHVFSWISKNYSKKQYVSLGL